MDGSAPWYLGGGGGVKGEGRKDGWQCSLVHRGRGGVKGEGRKDGWQCSLVHRGRGWCERRGEERWMAVLLVREQSHYT